MARKSFIFVNNGDDPDGISLDHHSEPAGFTFVHSSGTAELSKPAAKLMRGHVTKVNFARRRQTTQAAKPAPAPAKSRPRESRKIDGAAKDGAADVARRPSLGSQGDGHTKSSCDLPVPSSSSSTSGLLCHEELVSRYLTLAYSEEDTVTHPPNETEAMWHQYFEVEPALVDAAMAIAFRKWHPDPACLDWTAEMYSQRATTQLIRRMESPGARPDNILAVAATMGFAAQLTGNRALCEMHEKGVVAIATQRCSQARFPWLNDLVLLDSMNYVFGFSRMFFNPLIHVLAKRDPELLHVLQLLDGIVDLRTLITSHRRATTGDGSNLAEIEGRVARLRDDAKAFRTHENACLRVATRASELLLELLWPSTPPSGDKTKRTALAEEIGTLIRQLEFRTCIYNDLTSCTYMLCAIGAERGSPTRAWFLNASRRSARLLKAYGWVEPIRMLEPWLGSDLLLMEEIRELMKEVAEEPDQTEDVQNAMNAASLA